MTVYRPAKSPYFHYDFQFRGQRFTGSTSQRSKTEARRYEERIRREVTSGTKAKPSITLDEAIGLWWQHKGQFQASKATTEDQGQTLNRLLGRTKALADIDDADFRQFVARRRAHITKRKAPLANASINREVELARRVWRYVAKDYEVSDISWGALLLPEPKERVREMGAEEEVRFWAKAANEDLAAVAEFALLSGQRRTSVITLLRSKVFLQEMRAEVRVKGGHWHSFPLTPRLADIIRRQPIVCAQVFTYVCERPAPPRKDRSRRLRGHRYPFSKQGWYRKWRDWLTAAEIEDFRFHDLRHTTGTRIVRATGNLKLAQKLLGHTDIATTARYAHVIEADIRAGMIAAESRIIPEPATSEVTENGGNARVSG